MFDFKVNIRQKDKEKETDDIEILCLENRSPQNTSQSNIFIFLFNKQFNETGNCIAT